jgi:hypothetical protein
MVMPYMLAIMHQNNVDHATTANQSSSKDDACPEKQGIEA